MANSRTITKFRKRGSCIIDGHQVHHSISNCILQVQFDSHHQIKLNIVYTQTTSPKQREKVREEVLEIKKDIIEIMEKHGFFIP